MEQDEVDNSFTYNICKEEKKKNKHKSTLKQEKYFKITSFKDATVSSDRRVSKQFKSLSNLNLQQFKSCEALIVYER